MGILLEAEKQLRLFRNTIGNKEGIVPKWAFWLTQKSSDALSGNIWICLKNFLLKL